MRTTASIAHHPIHPMLVTVPIGLWLFSLVCDLVYSLGPGDTVWYTVATYNLVAGIVGALLAAIVGYIDMRSLPPDVKKIAVKHMTLNLIIVALYVVNAWLRIAPGEYSILPLLLSLIAVLMLGVSGWLGGHMVYVLQAGVDTRGAGTSAPASASARAGKRHART